MTKKKNSTTRPELREEFTNEPAPVSVQIPASCPHCGSTSRQALNCTRKYQGTFKYQGKEYNTCTFSYTRCKACARAYIIKRFDNE